ncbi:pentapeptide repeat-containing protein [Pseudanabaena sp. PCC 6802]|uniref:pentapeptide repeat-containing protein n=1 Tax=Pseudanabaena sp. PCC 6802 TaxID=118173 RepID=UPI000349E13A|nr:pentapeptide repeat-containing protein [Pseudanabaena sp. PCC 6802]
MGNSTPPDRQRDNDFLETEDEDLSNIDWSMLTDLSTKITNSNLDAATAKQSQSSASSSPFDLPGWAEEVEDTEASLAEMLGLEGLDDSTLEDVSGDLAAELGLENFDDRFSARERSGDNFDLNLDLDSPINLSSNSSSHESADATIITSNPVSSNPAVSDPEIFSNDEPESAGSIDPVDELLAEAANISDFPLDEDENLNWNITDRDLQAYTNPANIGYNTYTTDESGWGDDSGGDREDYASYEFDPDYGTNANASDEKRATDVPDYYADEVEPASLDRYATPLSSQDQNLDFDLGSSGDPFAESPPMPQDILGMQPAENMAIAPDKPQQASRWEFSSASDVGIDELDIDREFSDLDAMDENFSDSTKIENDSRFGSENDASARYSADWEEELSSSYYSDVTEQELMEALHQNRADRDRGMESADIADDDLFGIPSDYVEQQEALDEEDNTGLANSISLPSPPPLPPLPSLPPLPPLDRTNRTRPSNSATPRQDNPSTKTRQQKDFEQFESFDLPDVEWAETISPRLGENTGLREERPSNPIPPHMVPKNIKSNPVKGSSEYKKQLSDNISNDTSWSEILDRQPDISEEMNNTGYGAANTVKPDRSAFIPNASKQDRQPDRDLPVDSIGQMGAFDDYDDDIDDYEIPKFTQASDLSDADFQRRAKRGINLGELWQYYGGYLKIPAIAIGAIAVVWGIFSIPPIKRFSTEIGLRTGLNRNAAGQDLAGINLKGSNLEKANFDNANLASANLEAANLKGASLIGTKLNGANLQKADLKGARLVNANLVLANLSNAALNQADLSSANLAKTNLTNANMSGALLKDSQIDLNDPKSPTKIDDEDLLMWQIVNEPRGNRNLAGINMTGFNLSSAKLQGANLVGAKLAWADLSLSDLSNAKLDGSELSGANLNGANLRGANIASATWAKDRTPKTDGQTTCPNGTPGPCKF